MGSIYSSVSEITTCSLPLPNCLSIASVTSFKRKSNPQSKRLHAAVKIHISACSHRDWLSKQEDIKVTWPGRCSHGEWKQCWAQRLLQWAAPEHGQFVAVFQFPNIHDLMCQGAVKYNIRFKLSQFFFFFFFWWLKYDVAHKRSSG